MQCDVHIKRTLLSEERSEEWESCNVHYDL